MVKRAMKFKILYWISVKIDWVEEEICEIIIGNDYVFFSFVAGNTTNKCCINLCICHWFSRSEWSWCICTMIRHRKRWINLNAHTTWCHWIFDNGGRSNRCWFYDNICTLYKDTEIRRCYVFRTRTYDSELGLLDLEMH